MTNGTHFLVYTTEEGGRFQAYGRVNETEFAAIKATRQLRLNHWSDGPPEVVEPFFIMLLRVEDNFDYGLGCSRDDADGLGRALARTAA